MRCHTGGCARTVSDARPKKKPFAQGWRLICDPCFEAWMATVPRATGAGRHVTDLLTERVRIIED